jgi:hypothetical protein
VTDDGSGCGGATDPAVAAWMSRGGRIPDWVRLGQKA